MNTASNCPSQPFRLPLLTVLLTISLLFFGACKRQIVAPQRSLHLQLGNPTNAKTSADVPDNYLIEKPQYTMSYNRTNVTPNWVAWHLAAEDLGGAERQDNFRPDPALPAGWTAAKPADYAGSGFDRGHLCPSADRTATDTDNSATFLMTNIVPQAPNLNRNTWESLESYSRDLVKAGNELYIYAGTYGTGGKGSEGSANRLKDKINIPEACWKIVLILPAGDNDFSRVAEATQVIAVWMPNTQSVTNSWRSYRVSIDEIEQKTGYDFFADLPVSVQASLESKIYSEK